MPGVVILGGGPTADAIRQRAGLISEIAAHWEAIRCMEANARQFAAERGFATVKTLDVAGEDENRSSIAVLTEIERHVRTSALPMNWTVTSDSIAAWFAAACAARELVLLKSCDGSGRTAFELSAAGVVDDYFPTIAEHVTFRVVNLRNVVRARNAL